MVKTDQVDSSGGLSEFPVSAIQIPGIRILETNSDWPLKCRLDVLWPVDLFTQMVAS